MTFPEDSDAIDTRPNGFSSKDSRPEESVPEPSPADPVPHVPRYDSYESRTDGADAENVDGAEARADESDTRDYDSTDSTSRGTSYQGPRPRDSDARYRDQTDRYSNLPRWPRSNNSSGRSAPDERWSERGEYRRDYRRPDNSGGYNRGGYSNNSGYVSNTYRRSYNRGYGEGDDGRDSRDGWTGRPGYNNREGRSGNFDGGYRGGYSSGGYGGNASNYERGDADGRGGYNRGGSGEDSYRGGRGGYERDEDSYGRGRNWRRGPRTDGEREPLSLAEELADRGVFDQDEAGDKLYDQIKEKGDIQLDILRKMSMSDLLEESRREHVGEVCGMNRRDLIFKILKEKVRSGGVMFGSGTLEILPDGFGFLRSSDCHYLSCPDDIYVSPSQIRRFGLQTGSIVAGQIRPPKETERYFALLRVEKINGLDPSSANHRIMFDDLTPLHPDKRIAMDAFPEEISTRVVDLIAPVGFGQRGLIVSPPRAGKTILMQKMAQSAIKNYPDLYVMMLLIDERPEEVTDAERQIKGPQCEVISSTFDEAPSRHIQVAEMVLEKAKRLVECGRDVLIFLDSITRLARAYNAECPMSGKLLSGGVDANALQKPKRFFGSARKVEEGGSLTIIATALVETGSRMDEVIFEEFKGTGNMEIVLDRRLVEQRVWPAIDVNRSGTRREEALMDPDEYQRICVLHRALGVLDPTEAMTQLTARLAKTKSNAEFLMSIRADQD